MTKFAITTTVATVVLVIAIGFLILRSRDQTKISEGVTTYTIPTPEEKLYIPKQLDSELTQSLTAERKIKLDTPVKKI